MAVHFFSEKVDFVKYKHKN